MSFKAKYLIWVSTKLYQNFLKRLFEVISVKFEILHTHIHRHYANAILIGLVFLFFYYFFLTFLYLELIEKLINRKYILINKKYKCIWKKIIFLQEITFSNHIILYNFTLSLFSLICIFHPSCLPHFSCHTLPLFFPFSLSIYFFSSLLSPLEPFYSLSLTFLSPISLQTSLQNHLMDATFNT